MVLLFPKKDLRATIALYTQYFLHKSKKRMTEGDFCCDEEGNILYCGIFSEQKADILEIGIIGASCERERFKRFSKAVEAVVRSMGITAEWESVVHTNQQFVDLHKNAETKFVTGNQLAAEDIPLAAILEDQRARSLSLLIKSSGGVLLPDILKKGGLEIDDANAALERLTAAALVNREHVIICKKSAGQINRVNSVDSLRKFLDLDVRCSCGTPIAQERIEDLYIPSNKLQRMLDQSFWMSVWLVKTLIAVGIAADRVMLNLHEGPEEIDAFVDANGKLALFELKDREFSMGDAYPFGARVALYKPDYAFIISTRGVAPEVKEHFKRIKLPCQFFYLDSLSQLESTVGDLLANLNRRQAVEVLSRFNDLRNIEMPLLPFF